jgi:hypothetical protein
MERFCWNKVVSDFEYIATKVMKRSNFIVNVLSN